MRIGSARGPSTCRIMPLSARPTGIDPAHIGGIILETARKSKKKRREYVRRAFGSGEAGY